MESETQVQIRLTLQDRLLVVLELDGISFHCSSIYCYIVHSRTQCDIAEFHRRNHLCPNSCYSNQL